MNVDKTQITINTYNNIVQEYIHYYRSQWNKNTVQFKAETDYLANKLENKAKILDAGTAIGDYAKYLTEIYNKDFNVTGIDAAENLLKIAVQNAPMAKFQLMDVRDIKFPNNSFNAIICFATLIHIDDENCMKVLNKFNDLLIDNGIIAINVMEHNNNEKELFIPDPFNANFMSYFNRYSKKFFIDYFNNHNYVVEKIFDNIVTAEGSGDEITGSNEFTIIAVKK